MPPVKALRAAQAELFPKPKEVAALYVIDGGVYFGLAGVDPWPEERDARLYEGPWPVVAHPPCERWGRYWSGGPSSQTRYKLGDDGGKFESALAAVRTWGGVLEHPRDSQAYRAYGLAAPPYEGGWVPAGDGLGWTCAVDQGFYGHLAQKPTWLYVVGVRSNRLPDLLWGPSDEVVKQRLEKLGRVIRRRGMCEQLSRRQRSSTPVQFRDLLLRMAHMIEEAALRLDPATMTPDEMIEMLASEPVSLGFRNLLIGIARMVEPVAS